MTPWVLALVLLWPGALRARADEAGTAKHASGLDDPFAPPRPFFPGAHEQARSEDRATARELEHLLGALTGVAQARVMMNRADPSLLPIDAPVPAPKLTVLLQVLDGGPNPNELSAVLDAARTASLPPASIEVLQTRAVPSATREPDHQRARPDETLDSPLRTLLAVSLAANVLLATVLLVRLRFRVG